VFDLYGKPTRKRYKTFVATWRPAGGAIRVMLLDEPVQRAVDQDQAGEVRMQEEEKGVTACWIWMAANPSRIVISAKFRGAAFISGSK
jgi:hypothetical protein